MAFELITDTSANLPEEIIEAFGIKIVSLSFYVNSVEYKSYEKGKKTDLSQFYDMMRRKEEVKTSLVSPEAFEEIFEKTAKNGSDILYIGISSALSGTVQSARVAAELIKEKYPERNIVVYDSLAASLGQGLLVYKAAVMKKEGKNMEEIRQMLDDVRLKLCHWFTVDDLFFLSRGGRVSTTTAFMGTLLNIKPVLHVDDEGRLIPVGKVRGRKQSLNYLIDKFRELNISGENSIIAISHGDCLEDAEYVKNELSKTYKFDNIIINCIDPVIGAHSGPGTLALFFVGEHR